MVRSSTNRSLTEARRPPTSPAVRAIRAAVLLLIAVVIVGWLVFNALRAEPVSSSVAQADDFVPVEVVDDPSTGAPTPVETTLPEETLASVVPSDRIIEAVSATSAWRVLTGECPTTPMILENTRDAGATWSGFDLTTTSGFSAVQTLDVAHPSQVDAVGLSAVSCVPRSVLTENDGLSWTSAAEGLAESWYVNPADRALVLTPEGPQVAPCVSVVGLAAGGSNAAVLCADGTIHRTTNYGFQWTKEVSVPGAVAVEETDTGFLVAASGRPECAGVQLLALDREGSAAAAVVGCKPVSFAPGQVSLSVSQTGAMWLWAGEYIGVSIDGGVTWT